MSSTRNKPLPPHRRASLQLPDGADAWPVELIATTYGAPEKTCLDKVAALPVMEI